jgi:hypothetical protein
VAALSDASNSPARVVRLPTGDLVEVAADGSISVMGQQKQIIIRSPGIPSIYGQQRLSVQKVCVVVHSLFGHRKRRNPLQRTGFWIFSYL